MNLAELFLTRRRLFPGLSAPPGSEVVHLNNAAGTEMPGSAIDAMASYMRSNFCNEGAIYRRLDANRSLVQRTREATADLLGVSASEIAFGYNTTNNLYAVTRALARFFRPGDRVLVSEACHEANVAPWLTLKSADIDVEIVPMLADTHVDYERLESLLDDRTRLVSIGASSNCTGTIHDIQRVIRSARRVGALVSIDAAHYVPHHPVDVRALDCDLFFMSAYKCYGPHIGVFWIRPELCSQLSPVAIDMGVDPRFTYRFEMGTRNLEAHAGWLATIEYLADLGRAAAAAAAEQTPATRRDALVRALQAIEAWEATLTKHGEEVIVSLPGVRAYRQPMSDKRPSLGVFTFNVDGIEPEVVSTALAAANVEGVTGHNGAVRTMKKLAAERNGIGIRLSIAHYNTLDDLERASACLRELLGRTTR